MLVPRVGIGVDSHRLVCGRALIIGGVVIESERGLVGHSDADVLCHAISDALLGAASLGDLGEHFPPTDERWRDADSIDLLASVSALTRAKGFMIGNVDAAVMLEEPRLAPYRKSMIAKLAQACSCPVEQVSVKATTAEKMGLIGANEGIAAFAVALLLRPQ